MNLRITTLFFGILLATLWVFGLMIAQRKAATDQTLVIPSMSAPNVKIDRLQFKRYDTAKSKDLPEVDFVLVGEQWYLKEGKQQTKVEGFRIDNMIRDIKNAKNDETADTAKEPAHYGFRNPQLVLTLSGKVRDDEKEWTLKVGNEVGGLMYVIASERPDKVLAVPKTSLDSLFFKDPNHLRPKHLFNFTDIAVKMIDLEKANKKLELKHGENNLWTFVAPPLGHAEFTDTVEEKKEDKFNPKAPPPPPPAATGVKSLLESVKNIRVEEDDDFVPLGKTPDQYGVGDKAAMKIEIKSGAEKKDKADETLLIGDKVRDRKPGEEYYYARFAGDDGVMQINAKYLGPIEKAINEPGKIRSLNIATFDAKTVDAIVLKQGKEDVKFFKPEGETAWQMYADGKKYKADAKTMDALLEQLHGKKAIVRFLDAPEGDLKKKDAEWGFDMPAGEILVYAGGIEKAKKEDEKKDADKKDEKAKKDEKTAKEEKKDKDAPPALKADAMAALVLTLGKSDKETVNVLRKLESGVESRFTLKKEFEEKVFPPTGIVLAYLDTALPKFAVADVTGLELQRATDRGKEKFDLVRFGDRAWYLKDSQESTGLKQADARTAQALASLSELPVKKWVKKLDPKEDLDKYGLKEPAASVFVTVKKPVDKNIASILGMPGAGLSPLHLAATAVMQHQLDKGEVIWIKWGKEADGEKDKQAVYAMHSGIDRLFLISSETLDFAKRADLYDRSFMLQTYPERVLSELALAAGNPISALVLASPMIRGNVHNFDPDKVTDIRLTIRTPFELRTFGFAKKDKAWIDSTGLQEFRPDQDKVNQLVKDMARLHTDRFVTYSTGPRTEHKLDAKDANAKIDLKLQGGQVITVTIGTNYQSHGYFAHSSYWPEAVFFVPISMVDPLLSGVAHFSKARSGS